MLVVFFSKYSTSALHSERGAIWLLAFVLKNAGGIVGWLTKDSQPFQVGYVGAIKTVLKDMGVEMWQRGRDLRGWKNLKP